MNRRRVKAGLWIHNGSTARSVSHVPLPSSGLDLQEPRRPDLEEVALGLTVVAGVREGGATFPSDPRRNPGFFLPEKSGMFRGPFFIPYPSLKVYGYFVQLEIMQSTCSSASVPCALALLNDLAQSHV